MFTEMVQTLGENSLPEIEPLKGRLHIALIKKEAIFALPPNFRVADPKMNPRADHLIWAAVLLADAELFAITRSIYLTEMAQKKEIKQDQHRKLIDNVLQRLLHMPSDPQIKKNIQKSINSLLSHHLGL